MLAFFVLSRGFFVSLFRFLLGAFQPAWELGVGGKVGFSLSLFFSCLSLGHIRILHVYFVKPFCKHL